MSDSAQRAVWGSVRDALRQPLAGVQVYVEEGKCGMLTDEEGRYALVGVPLGPLSIRADLIGYVSAVARLRDAVDNEERNLVLQMPWGDEELVALAGQDPWGIPRRIAAAAVGCYQIVTLEEYGAPMRPYGGPWKRRPANFRGLPVLVLVDTFSAGGDSLALRGRTLGHRLDQDLQGGKEDPVAWRFSMNGDSLDGTWTGSPMIWWIRYRLSVDADSLPGRTWFVSHEPGTGTAPRPVVWRRSQCGSGGLD